MKSILFLVALILSTVAHAADLPRVAVVPDSPEPSVAAFADFLSVSLAAASNQYTLVERAEITRLASEAEVQKLAADQRPAALAKLAKADGLIIVGADKGDPKLPKLTLRLTSTNNGLVLRSLILGGKESEYPKAAELAAGVLRFPCERLTHGDAKPPIIVSLLGIRPAFEIDRPLETTLNLAVAQQLSAQSGIAVSERWKMHDLVFERSLADEKPQSFATGTVLLDGSYTLKGDQLEFSLRLRKAEDEAGKTLTLQGPANKPVELAQQIAKLVATESGQSGELLAWDALEEGKQYAELGWWLYTRNLCDESAKAFESAIALGYPNGFALRNRMWAYSGIIEFKVGFMPARTGIDGWEQLPKSEFKRKVMAAIRCTQCANEMLDVNFGGLSQQEFSRDDRYTALLIVFAQNMKVLQAVCLRGEQLELATEARTLRALSRELVVKGEAAIKNNFAGDVAQRFYMHDTPEQAAADLRGLLDPRKMGNEHWSKGRWLRCHFWQTSEDPDLWRFVDWSSTDNRNGRETWNRMVAELTGSRLLLHQVDGLALAFQKARDANERDGILAAYLALLDEHFDEFRKPAGQMTFFAFYSYYYMLGDEFAGSSFHSRLAGILTRMFESGTWMEPATLEMAAWNVRYWKRNPERRARVVPESQALAMLAAIEKYIRWAKADPRWKSQYQNPNFGVVGKSLLRIPEDIILTYPGIREQRIKVRPPVPGAVAIRAWKPAFPGASAKGVWMSADHIIAHGDSLLIPSNEHGVIELDTAKLAVSRVLGLPFRERKFIGGFAANRDSLMILMDNRLFVSPLAGDGGKWNEIEIPELGGNKDLTWRIDGLGDSFFLGSRMLDEESGEPRMLAGEVRDGKVTWSASSNRRPVVNPLDRMDPRHARLAYRNARGGTIVLLDQRGNRAPVMELETGREVSSLISLGKVQARGEMPLYWQFDEESIQLLAAFDPGREQPRLLFRPTNTFLWGLPDIWKDVKPVHDSSRPEFQGQCIAAIIHGGCLWLLKREADELGASEKNGPDDFRLVRAGLDGGDPVVIPLRYDVPESIRNLGDNEQSSLQRPIINGLSLTATRAGLFFGTSGYDYGRGNHYAGGIPAGGIRCPVLLHITWDDIHAWLAKNGK